MIVLESRKTGEREGIEPGRERFTNPDISAPKAGRLILAFSMAICLVLPPTPSVAAGNTCTDPATWKEWEEVIARHPGDEDYRALYALRIGLCVLVDRKELTLDQATRIFEEQRTATIRRKQMQAGNSAEMEI